MARSRDSEATDADLMVRLATDEGAFEALYRRYVRRVTAYAARRCWCPEDVADAVAQTFVRVLRQVDQYDPDRGSVVSFIFTLAGSEVADVRRRDSRQRALLDRVEAPALLSPDDVSRLEEVIDARRAVSALAPALATLPLAEAEVVRLVADGLTPTEAARTLAISPNAARVRLAPARRRLRDHAAAAPGVVTTPPPSADPA